MEKFSQYNYEIQNNDELIIFNTISSAVLSLENRYANPYFQSKKNNDLSLLPTELYDNMKEGSIIINNDIDELNYLDAMHRLYRYQNNKLVLTIAPTLECNFACPYCYEAGRRNNSMSSDMQSKLLKYIDNQMQNKKQMIISWYGGEPLLQLDTITSFTKHFIEKGYDFNASMVTNGYLLTPEVVHNLKDLNVSFLQITLDGPPDIHDKRRFLINGSPTFKTIIKNISYACDIIPIRIRVNVDYKNIDKINDLLDYLDTYELAGRVNVYISPVHNLNTNCNAQNCMTNSEFSKVQIDFYKKYKHRRYFDLHIPQCNVELCSAVTSFSHTVDPNGNLYKCWNDIGDNDEVIGSIVSDFKSTTTHTKWLTYSPFESENCKKCKLLPICLGGCPDFYIKKEIHNCHHLKNNIEDFIQVFRMYKEEKLNNQY